MMKNFSITAAALIIVAFGGVYAQAADPGEAAYSFLKIGTDARSEAMGGAMTAVADHLGSSFYNPSALARTAPRSVMASYVNWLTDIQAGSLAATWAVGRTGRIGAFAQYLDYGTFDPRKADGTPGEDFSASDVAVALTWAGLAGESFAYGVSGRFISESIDDVSSTALAADLGMTYEFQDKRTRVGLAS